MSMGYYKDQFGLENINEREDGLYSDDEIEAFYRDSIDDDECMELFIGVE